MPHFAYIRWLTPFLLFFSMTSTTVAEVDTSVVGRTFVIPGPNCFSTALRVTGMYPTFRGVDVGEFQAVMESQCVEVQTPERGDIGTYHSPDGMALHAFVFLDNEKGLEKAGVDYLGKSAVVENSLVNIDYIRYASPECRQYSSDITLCSNVRKYFHCTMNTNTPDTTHSTHSATVAQVETLMMTLIDGEAPKSYEAKILSQLEEKMQLTKEQVDIFSNINDPQSKYYRARYNSLTDQLLFIKNALQN